MEFFTLVHILRMCIELFLAVCLKLLCDNGRINWRDLVNDLFFWLPGVKQKSGDGLSREIGISETRDEEKDQQHVEKFSQNIFAIAMIGALAFISVATVIILL